MGYVGLAGEFTKGTETGDGSATQAFPGAVLGHGGEAVSRLRIPLMVSGGPAVFTGGSDHAQDWLAKSQAFMIAVNEMSGFQPNNGGQAYPPVFPWYVLGSPQSAPATTDVVVLTSPLDANFITECHKLKMKCLCYVAFNPGPPNVSIPSSDPDVVGPLTSRTYMGVGFSEVWWEKAVDGTVNVDPRFRAGNPPVAVDGVGVELGTTTGTGSITGTTDVTGFPVACCNTQPYADAMLAWIDVIMGRGADGVFVDFVELRQPCYGDVANANNTTHTHLYTRSSPIPRLNPSDPADPFANWIALAEPSGSQTLAEAQDAAGRQGAQNWAYAQLLRQVRARVRRHKSDGAVVGNAGFPNFPGQWMQWFQQYLDGVMIENFITPPGPGKRAAQFGGLQTGFYNLSSPGTPAPTQPPGNPAAVEVVPWPAMLAGNLRPWVQSGNRLVTLSWISNQTQTPKNTSPSSSYDVPAREDAFFTYGASLLAGGTWWGGPVWSALPGNPNTDFADLHAIVLGPPVGGLVQLDASGQVQSGVTSETETTVGVFERGIVAVNWTNDASGATFSQLQTIVGAAGNSAALPEELYDLFDRAEIDLSSDGPEPIVPAATPATSSPVAGQARVYLYQAQPAYGKDSIRTPELETWPGPSNATSFGPSSPALSGGPFLYTWSSAMNDIFGITIGTGPEGTPYPWPGTQPQPSAGT